jgi:uncharacterized damage-inducible protein DinB
MIADLLLPEFDAEMATTRRILERVPDDHIEWKPHEKSFPMGHLAQLVTMIPGWAVQVLRDTEFDIAPREGPTAVYRFYPVAQLLKMFDQNVAEARPVLAKVTDEELEVTWTLKAGGHPVNVQPRYTMYRMMVMNHLVHHRAQLGFYLRLTDQKVPSMYGPTADDKEAQQK